VGKVGVTRMTGRGGYRLLEHTADIGLEIRGASLGELFEQACQGLREVMFGSICGDPVAWKVISVTGQEEGELLVHWLNEFLFRWETENWIPVEVTITEITGRHLKARVGGFFFDPAKHGIEREVKAATYHQLQVKEANGEWRGRIFLDL